MTGGYLPFTNEKFLWARLKISPSKYTRKPAIVRCNENGERHRLAGVYLVWSPCGLLVYPPTGCSYLRLWNATRHAQHALRHYQREGGAPKGSSGRPGASRVAPAVSSARGGSGYHLRTSNARSRRSVADEGGRYDTYGWSTQDTDDLA